MANLGVSLKHIQVDKANSSMVLSVALASFIVVFAGFAAHSLLERRSYQAELIRQKETALEQITENETNARALEASYSSFVSGSENIIGGNADPDLDNIGPRDGDNARLVLDALPSKYDFPALVTSIEAILRAQNVDIAGISGTDDELNYADVDDRPAPSETAPVDIPFSIEFNGDYADIQRLIDALERSIRPLHVEFIAMQGNEDQLRVEVQARTYFQPERIFSVETEVLRP